MQEPSEWGGLAQALAALLDLSRRARQARSEAELGFLLVNESLQLVSYRQAVLWEAGVGVKMLSGLVQPEVNAPYALWLKAVCRHLVAAGGSAQPIDAPRSLDAADLPAALAQEWLEWWPAHAVWIPMPSAPQTTTAEAPVAGGASAGAAGGSSAAGLNQSPPLPVSAGLLLAREAPWSAAELSLLQDWTSAWWHARQSLRRAQRRGLAWPWQRATRGALPDSRPWWRRPGLWLAGALVAAAFVPVRISVLAAGELVPRSPAVVRAPLEGVVDTFHVQPNQWVRKGDPLFGFDEALIQSRLDVASQALNTANTEYRQTMQQALVDPRVRPQLAALTGRAQEKRTEVAFLREQLARARVLAPQDGVALFDDPTEWIGKPVSVGERVLRIAALTDVEVEAWLPVADAIALPPDAPVLLYLNASPLEPVPARLRYLAHEAVQRPDGLYAYRVRATLEAPTAHRVGLKGTAKIQGDWVPAGYWVMRRPIATLRSTLGL